MGGGRSTRSASSRITTLSAWAFIPFTLAVLPDTQIYARYHPEIFESQARWIRRNRVRKNIVFALHEGDITDTDSDAEWSVAVRSMGLLDGFVPYALVMGNHDVAGALGMTRHAPRFDAHFPLADVAARSSAI